MLVAAASGQIRGSGLHKFDGQGNVAVADGDYGRVQVYCGATIEPNCGMQAAIPLVPVHLIIPAASRLPVQATSLQPTRVIIEYRCCATAQHPPPAR